MTYQELLAAINGFPGVTDDSRQVVPGGVFVAGGGRRLSDQYLRDAVARGASLVVTQQALVLPGAMQQVIVPDRSIASAELATTFYGNPSSQLTVIGVTGTCGKTTSTYLLEAIMSASGKKVGVIGTENIRYDGKTFPSPNTTPSAFILQSTLHKMMVAGCDVVVMEVSSHALEQGRTLGVLFDGAIFTNLSVEHLDMHGTMEAYYQAKKKLFAEYATAAAAFGKATKVVINTQDEAGARLAAELASAGAQTDDMACFTSRDMRNIAVGPRGISGDFRSSQGSRDIRIDSPLIGSFNVENIAGAVLLAGLLGIDDADIEKGIRDMQPVPGRMEMLPGIRDISVIVDYAHKPGALEVVLETLREICTARLICVLGSGGRRDVAKRPLMGDIASRLADIVIVTADNSRGEGVPDIITDIVAGVCPDYRAKVHKILDRRAAIEVAIKLAQRGDIVMIAGRGAEPLLSILRTDGTEELIRFDDRLVAADVARHRFETASIN